MFWSLVHLLALEIVAEPYLGMYQYKLPSESSVWDPIPSPMKNEINQRESSPDYIFRGEIVAMFFEKYKWYVRRNNYQRDDENDTVLTIDLFELLSTEKVRELPENDQKTVELAPWDTVWNHLGSTRIHRFAHEIARLYERLWNRLSPALECVCRPSRGQFVEWTSTESVRHRVLFFNVVFHSKYEASFSRQKSRKFHKSTRRNSRTSLGRDSSFDSSFRARKITAFKYLRSFVSGQHPVVRQNLRDSCHSPEPC